MSNCAYIMESFGLGQAKLDFCALVVFHSILADSEGMVGI